MSTILLCSLITIATFLFWEFVAWFTHKYIMHGVLWVWHKSHHRVHHHALEKNDWFAVVFSVPSIAIFYYFSLVSYNPYWLAVGLGIFFYGLFYMIFHDMAWRLFVVLLYSLGLSRYQESRRRGLRIGPPLWPP